MRTHSLRSNLVLILACLLVIVLCLLGLSGPGSHIWGRFLLPIVVVFLWGSRDSWRRDIYFVTGLASVFVVVTFWTDGAKTLEDLLVNHLLPLAILWAAAWLLARQRQLQEQLARSRQDLEQQVKTHTAALAAGEQQLAKIFSANPGGIAITRQSDGVCLDANDAYLAVVGYSRTELVGRSLVDLRIMSAAVRDEVRAALQAQGAIHGLDLQIFNARGEPVDILYSLERIDFNGEPCYLGLVFDITERKRLEGRANHLAAIVAASHDAIISAALDGTVISVNPSAEALYGVSAALVVGRNAADVALPQNIPSFQEMLGRVAAGEIVTTDDASWQLPDGTARSLSISISPIRDGTGPVIAFAAMARDITARKAAGHALRASEERFTRLFHTSPVGITLTRLADGLFREVNAAFLMMVGCSRDELIGRTILDLGIITPEDRTRLAASLQAEGRLQGLDLVLHTKRGENLYTLYAIELIDFGGEPCLLSSVVDITARKQLEEQLRAAFQRLELATDTAGIGVWTWDFAANNLEWDDRMCELHALTATERGAGISYDLWRSRIHPDDLALADPAQGYPGHIGDEAAAVYRIVLPDGAVRYIQANAQIEYESDGRPRHIIGINRDITDQKLYEHLLQDTNAVLEQRVAARTADLQAAFVELQHANQLKDEFLAMISHELRTPLTGVLSMSEMLEEQIAGPLNARQVYYVRGIIESGERLLAVINGILGYTHLISGKVQIDAEPCELANLFAICAASQQHKAAQKQQTIAVQVQPPDLTITADATALAEVLKRLLDNAVKFTPAGGQIGLEAYPAPVRRRPPTVRRSLHTLPDPEGDAVEITVWDTGIGIPDGQLDHIVKPFTQADARLARTHEGIGLGLAYVDQMVRLMGGILVIQSTPAEGSRFTITLPA